MLFISFVLRASKADKNFSTVIINIQSKPERFRLSTGIKILSKHWTERQRLKVPRSHPENQEINELLNSWESKIRALYHRELKISGRPPSKKAYSGLINSSGEDADSVLVYIKKVFCQKRLSQGRIISQASLLKFKTLAHHLQKFQESYGYQLTWARIDSKFKQDLDQYFFQDCELAANTGNRYYKHLKQVIKHAQNEGLHTNTYFQHSDFVPPAESLVKVFLNEAELQRMADLDLEKNERLGKVRDAFLVGCWTGLRHSDWHKVTSATIKGHVIRVIQTKTRKPVILPLAPEIETIVQAYGAQGVNKISNQKLNDYIKEVAQLAQIDDLFITSVTKGGHLITEQRQKWELVTSHTARRSFATNMYLRNYTPLEIMSATGHKTESEFLKYINVGALERAQKLAAKMRG